MNKLSALSYQLSAFKQKYQLKNVALAGIFASLLFVPLCFAQEVSFEATVDRTRVSLGQDIQLDLTFYGTQDVGTPYFPDIDGFGWQYLGPSRRVSIINGQVSSSVSHRYRLVARQAGTFQIPSFSIQYRGKTYSSDPIDVEVASGPVTQQPQTQRQAATPSQISGLEERVFMTMDVQKRKAYVNEVIPVNIKLYIHRLALRDIQYPEFDHEGFSVGEYGEPKQYQEVFNGMGYTVVEFNTEIFGLWAGDLKLGPAELKCDLLIRQRTSRPSWLDDDFFDSSIFDQYERYPLTLKAIELPVKILPLPQEGMPESFDGAIGDYKFYMKANPKEVKVGDPITVEMSVFGNGNYKTVNPPVFSSEDDFKIYDPEVKQNQGNKVFEQVIIPKNDKVDLVPEVKFSFFNPNKGKYEEVVRGPIPITVLPLEKGEGLKIFELDDEGEEQLRRKETLGRDIIYLKDSPGSLRKRGEVLCTNRLFILLQFIPLASIVLALMHQRRKEHLESDVRYARRLRAPGAARKNLRAVKRLLSTKETEKFFNAVFKTLQEYLGDKFHLPSAGITSAVIGELEDKKINPELLDKLSRCFANCDMARYAPSSITKEQMADAFRLLAEIIDGFERLKL
ncbi:MAG: protein BatD [Candidatus Omnitrophica bacterium]|nr:protein BatD [Candidatus Omnitrophota bacterium]